LIAKLEGRKLILEIYLEDPHPSKTGKMSLEYSTGGFKTITADGLRANIVIGRKTK